MKLLFLLLSTCALLFISSCSQKIEESKVPAKVKSSFDKQFPAVKADWEMGKGKYEANFKIDNKEQSASYSLDGTLVENEIEIPQTDLPENVKAYCAEHYKDKKIESAAKITNADGSINYEAEVNDKDLLFDTAGNFLTIAKD